MIERIFCDMWLNKVAFASDMMNKVLDSSPDAVSSSRLPSLHASKGRPHSALHLDVSDASMSEMQYASKVSQACINHILSHYQQDYMVLHGTCRGSAHHKA